ncbi:hypothetical protein [Streptomyces sp. NPDC056264]|uniref:hypothetical protein n=1 Tax=Streptomyces sp. NPDC056264 TaxID=3345767 RepID=UPI003AAE52C4
MDMHTGSINDAGRARLELTMDGGCLLSLTLGELALLNRLGLGTLTFTYRDPEDPEQPEAPRPLRTATLRITDDAEWPEDPRA